MICFSPEEEMLMMLYSPGNRPGLVAELEAMKTQLTKRERKLRGLTDSVLEKLAQISDDEFLQLDLYPDIE